ncbi:MAG: tetratricopeptide repeat protein [bacterium]
MKIALAILISAFLLFSGCQNPAKHFNNGESKLKSGDYKDAIADFTKAIKIEPEYSDAYLTRGFANFQAKNYNDAIRDFSKAIDLDSKKADIYMLRGSAKIKLGQKDKACLDFHKADEIGFSAYGQDKKFYEKQNKIVIEEHCDCKNLHQALPELQSGWERIYIKDLGSFDLPPTMEVQDGYYKELIDDMKNIKGYNVSKLIAQQKGLNALSDSASEKYARIMVTTDHGTPGDFRKLDYDINQFNENEIIELNKAFKDRIKLSLNRNNIKIIKWYPLKFEKINGMSCMHIKYIRQLNGNPDVLVNKYMFSNFDRGHELMISYRITEENYWKSDLEKVLNSFRISNIN